MPPLDPSYLSYLSSVREIDGYLLIQGLNQETVTDLRFLRNLEHIQGQNTIELRPGRAYSLLIEECPFLRTLGLASLQTIANGGVRITNNPQLCLVDTISFDDFLVNSTLKRTGGLGNDCSGMSVCLYYPKLLEQDKALVLKTVKVVPNQCPK